MNPALIRKAIEPILTGNTAMQSLVGVLTGHREGGSTQALAEIANARRGAMVFAHEQHAAQYRVGAMKATTLATVEKDLLSWRGPILVDNFAIITAAVDLTKRLKGVPFIVGQLEGAEQRAKDQEGAICRLIDQITSLQDRVRELEALLEKSDAPNT